MTPDFERSSLPGLSFQKFFLFSQICLGINKRVANLKTSVSNDSMCSVLAQDLVICEIGD